jgi:hypothetical protein
MEQESQEPDDRHHYQWVMFYRENVEFYVKALVFYEGLLDKDLSAINEDEHLNILLSDDVRREFKLEKGLRDAQRMREWLQGELNKKKGEFDCDLSLSHGSVRYLKSVGLLYINYLKIRRNKLSKRANISAKTLEAVDTQITRLEEGFTKGVFSKASLIFLLADQVSGDISENPVSDEKDEAIAFAARPKPVLIESIEILDKELKERCLDIFNLFAEAKQPERLDTVVAEATRILENRLRHLTKCTGSETGADLAAKAFGGANPMFQISSIKAEQEAVHLLFRGAFGYIRNRTQHKLLADLPPERVVQIVGFIDCLISLAESGIPAEQ